MLELICIKATIYRFTDNRAVITEYEDGA